MALLEDPTVFLEDFGVYVSLDGGSPTLAIFDNAFERASVGDLGMASTQPMIRLPIAAVPALAQRAPVVVGTDTLNDAGEIVGGTAYRFAEQEPDGTGWAMLFLECVR